MRRFAALYQSLDASTGTADKVAALQRYFGEAPAADAAWAVYFLAGGKPRQVLPTALLRSTACALAAIDDWLFEASYQAVGDLAETIALVLPPPVRRSDLGLAHWVEQRLLPLRGRRQHQRDGLGEIAHGLVAGLEQPVVDGRQRAGGAAQQRGGQHLARLAAGQKVHRPGGVGRRRVGEVALQRRHLVGRAGAGVQGLVEGGEAAHRPGDVGLTR